MKFTRITVNPRQMGGVPCIRGLRIPVATIVDTVADGISVKEIIKLYPDLEPEDIQEALRYAAEARASMSFFGRNELGQLSCLKTFQEK